MPVSSTERGGSIVKTHRAGTHLAPSLPEIGFMKRSPGDIVPVWEAPDVPTRSAHSDKKPRSVASNLALISATAFLVVWQSENPPFAGRQKTGRLLGDQLADVPLLGPFSRLPPPCHQGG